MFQVGSRTTIRNLDEKISSRPYRTVSRNQWLHGQGMIQVEQDLIYITKCRLELITLMGHWAQHTGFGGYGDAPVVLNTLKYLEIVKKSWAVQ